jgi:hypothetical protein
LERAVAVRVCERKGSWCVMRESEVGSDRLSVSKRILIVDYPPESGRSHGSHGWMENKSVNVDCE